MEIEFSFFSSGYLDVSVHRVPSVQLWIGCTVTEVCSVRFPHSEIDGSMDICSSPSLIAAYHVFHRLLVPRHPPYALIILTIFFRVASPYSVTTYQHLGRVVIFEYLKYISIPQEIFHFNEIFSCAVCGTLSSDVLKNCSIYINLILFFDISMCSFQGTNANQRFA